MKYSEKIDFAEDDNEELEVVVLKMTTGEVLLTVFDRVEEDVCAITDPLELTMSPMMTTNGIQLVQMLTPWLQGSLERQFFMNKSNIVTYGLAKPQLFELYVEAITSDKYIEQYTIGMETYDEEFNPNETPTEIVIKDPIIKSFKNNLEKCFEL